MPSRNEIVPLDASISAAECSEPNPRPGPGVVTVPVLPKLKVKTFGSKAKATTAEMASVQERRMLLVQAQRRYTAFQVFYGFSGLALMMMQMEYVWLANTRTLPESCPVESTTQCPLCFQALDTNVPVSEGRMVLLALRVLMSFSTTLMLYYIYLYYAAECEVMKLKNIMPPTATLLSSSLRHTLLIEMAVLAVHPFPGIEDVDPKWPQLTVAASLLMFTRVIFIIRVVQFRNSFNSSNGWFIGALTNVDFNATFFMKSTLKNHPTSCLMASFAVLGFAAGYSLYVAERFLCAFKADSCCQPMLLGDAIWMLVITILTIGYGDVVPRTTLGRAIAVTAGVFGTLSTAVTIAVMSNYLVLTRSEHKVNAFLKKDEHRRLLNDHAARALQAFAQLRAAQRRHNRAASLEVGETTGTTSTKRALRRAELKLFTVLSKYRQVKRRVHSHDVSDPIDSQMTMLEMMEVNVEYIRTKIEELSELFLAQNGVRSHSKRNLSNIIAAATIPESVTDTTTYSSIQSGGGCSVSLPPTRSSITLLQQLQQQPSQLQWSLRQPQQQQPNQPKQQTPTSQSILSSSIAYEATSVGADTQAATSSSDNVPRWAIMMELTLQSLLEQVSRVSGEVEALKSRIHAQSETLESRLMNLEKRLVVSDALNEMSRTRGSTRNLFLRALKSTEESPAFETSPRQRRVSATATHRPSIHNFVTASELLEFQTPNEEQGKG
ncbi:Voltage-gated Ion Channel (VIC) Superfamily [Phytophthora infestans T30-4]|uniref:Voltage-gated Ion Channel (VIC) Superfamily n=1 Tax=Phytophthora infestans (strain T30-4) TaxID=403677 RepID=D0NUU5_PHYIT|nr:Voltage-gated Ion Channel (VIC) Superfamily [Phytophthora infestans T30-4]EEY65468.1 Voltage-gated Ion Channel (VIC) Superfamily [Phytophthora infestans T30-4]|eukprot:XP_002897097.1 Voltage-gated Ion Channel (VIC) Superfamily [Phytophthora infestans T30-4]